MGSNYAPTLWVQKVHYYTIIASHLRNLLQEAEKAGCQQVLWVFGGDQEITEVGAMNIFILLRYIIPGVRMMMMMVSQSQVGR